jgi:hypothetical protein
MPSLVTCGIWWIYSVLFCDRSGLRLRWVDKWFSQNTDSTGKVSRSVEWLDSVQR